MLGAPSESSGKVNWTVAVAASVAVHVVVVGGALFFSGAFDSPDAPQVAAKSGAVDDGLGKTPEPEIENAATAADAAVTDDKGSNAGRGNGRGNAGSSGNAGNANAAATANGSGGGRAGSGRDSAGNATSAATAGSDGVEEYVAKPGDSLNKIAKRCGCSVAELAKLNGFPPTKGLQIGEKIKIPAKGR